MSRSPDALKGPHSIDCDEYLRGFGDFAEVSLEDLHREMDRVWVQLGLDNRLGLSAQASKVAEFYAHPVWVANGLFSELDSDSRRFRERIADWVKDSGARRLADFGGGSGVLARLICERVPGARVDIVEPWPSAYFVERNRAIKGLNYVDKLGSGYDVVIAQDVLEHLDDPIELAIALHDAVRVGGHLIFANCFFPVIQCHLPSTFYLRHQFKWLMSLAGSKYLGRVPGVEYAQIFRASGDLNASRLRGLARIGQKFGWLTNGAGTLLRGRKTNGTQG